MKFQRPDSAENHQSMYKTTVRLKNESTGGQTWKKHYGTQPKMTSIN